MHGQILSEGLAKRGHNVCIISTKHPEGRGEEKKTGVTIHYLNNTIFGSRRKGWPQASAEKFIELHSRSSFDLVWSQSFDAFGVLDLIKKINLPLIPTLHGSIQQELTTLQAKLFRMILHPPELISGIGGLFFSYLFTQKPVLSQSRKIITVSSRVTDDLSKWYGNKVARKCVVVPNGIDSRRFRPDDLARKNLRTKLGITEDETLLLTLGRLTYEKGHHLAIQALKLLRKRYSKIKLMISGSGNYYQHLVAQAERCGIDDLVIFTGPVANADIADLYNASDIFLMPTLTVEGLPMVLLEAMACGKPVVAARIGGNSGLIRDGRNGLLVKPNDARLMAEAIQYLLNQPAMREKMSASARQDVVKRYNGDRMVTQTLAIMENALLEYGKYDKDCG